MHTNTYLWVHSIHIRFLLHIHMLTENLMIHMDTHTHISHAGAVNLFESGQQCYIKAINNNSMHTHTHHMQVQ